MAQCYIAGLRSYDKCNDDSASLFSTRSRYKNEKEVSAGDQEGDVDRKQLAQGPVSGDECG